MVVNFRNILGRGLLHSLHVSCLYSNIRISRKPRKSWFSIWENLTHSRGIRFVYPWEISVGFFFKLTGKFWLNPGKSSENFSRTKNPKKLAMKKKTGNKLRESRKIVGQIKKTQFQKIMAKMQKQKTWIPKKTKLPENFGIIPKKMPENCWEDF